MTNEQYLNFLMMVGGGSAFTGLLDTYSGAKAAFSLRRLSSDYNGSAVQVRNKSTQTITDIGFDSDGIIDTTALATAANETGDTKQLGIVTWYDQSGNGNNATQNTASQQPNIYFGSGPVLENGKIAISFDGGNNLLLWNNVTAPTLFQDMSDAISVLLVEKATAISNASNAWFNGNTTIELRENSSASGTGVPFSIGYSNSNFGFGVSDDYTSNPELELSGAITSAQRLSTSFVNGDDLDVYLNSSSAISTTFTTATGDRSVGTGNSTLVIGSRSRDTGAADVSYFIGTMQEVIIYDSDQTSNRSGIETNINDYYSIY